MKMLAYLKKFLLGEKPLSLGDCVARSLSISVDCKACGVTTILSPKDVGLSEKVEVHLLKQMLACPTCGHHNEDGEIKTFFSVSG